MNDEKKILADYHARGPQTREGFCERQGITVNQLHHMLKKERQLRLSGKGAKVSMGVFRSKSAALPEKLGKQAAREGAVDVTALTKVRAKISAPAASAPSASVAVPAAVSVAPMASEGLDASLAVILSAVEKMRRENAELRATVERLEKERSEVASGLSMLVKAL